MKSPFHTGRPLATAIQITFAALLLALALGACKAKTTGSSPFTVGTASIDITPSFPVRLSGYSNRTEATDDVEHPLKAKALAIAAQDGSSPSVIITLDAIGIPAWLTDELAQRLEKASVIEALLDDDNDAIAGNQLASKRVNRARLAVCATHTHAGPHLRGVLPFMFPEAESREDSDASMRYTDELLDKLEKVARDALAHMEPGTLAWNQGSVGFAVNRRALKAGKWSGFGIEPESPVDHSLPALHVRNARGELKAVLATYACHCTTTGGDMNKIHGDWAGYAQNEIEKRHPGAVAMISIGCGADSNPNPRGELEMARQYGTQVADEVERLLGQPAKPLSQPPSGNYRTIEIAFDAAPPRDEWQQRADAGGRDSRFASAMLSRIDSGEVLPESLAYPIQTWTFGTELAMVFLAGEVVVDHAIGLRRKLDAERLWIHAYSNDVPCYIASRRLYGEGGYEVDSSMTYYGKPNRLAIDTEDRIANEITLRLSPDFSSGATRAPSGP